jgi:hypothetical protein
MPTVGVRFSESEHRVLVELAARENLTMSAVIRRLVLTEKAERDDTQRLSEIERLVGGALGQIEDLDKRLNRLEEMAGGSYA